MLHRQNAQVQMLPATLGCVMVAYVVFYDTQNTQNNVYKTFQTIISHESNDGYEYYSSRSTWN